MDDLNANVEDAEENAGSTDAAPSENGSGSEVSEPPPPATPIQPELEYEAADAADVAEVDSGVLPAEAEPGMADAALPATPTVESVADDGESDLDEMMATLQAADGEATTAPGEKPDETPGETPDGAAIAAEPAAEGEATPAAAEPADAAEPAPSAITAISAPLPAQEWTLRVTRVPFWVHAGVWALFTAVMTVLLWPKATAAFTGRELYGWFVIGGVSFAVLGPVVGLIVWLVVRARTEPGLRQGLTRAVLFRAAASTSAGVVLWWLALVLLDLHRAGLLG